VKLLRDLQNLNCELHKVAQAAPGPTGGAIALPDSMAVIWGRERTGRKG